jgi:hypothetical protein
MSSCAGTSVASKVARSPTRGATGAATGGYVPEGETLEELVAALRRQDERSRAVVVAHDLAEAGRPGPRWEGADPATLERMLFHLMQEYARHLGHLDVVVELADGVVGE